MRLLSEKVGTTIIAQELLEMLADQIIEHKTKEFDEENSKVPKSNKLNEEVNKNPIPKELIFASSDISEKPVEDSANLASKSQKLEEIDSDDKNLAVLSKINTRQILNSKDFISVLTITTLVPFIKPGIPRLSEYDVKEAKIAEKDHLKGKGKHYVPSQRMFIDNFLIRDQILKFKCEREKQAKSQAVKSPTPLPNLDMGEKHETMNLTMNPELHNATEGDSSNIDIESELKKSIDASAKKKSYNKSETPNKTVYGSTGTK